MKSDEQLNELLQILVHVVARAAIPPASVREIVGLGKKQIRAFNLCDGSLNQKDVSRKTKLDSGNFSRTVSRWVEQGVVFKLGESKQAKLLHIYPIGKEPKKRKPK
jgi:hypothetical protein